MENAEAGSSIEQQRVAEVQVRVWYPTFDGTELFLYTLRAGDLCAMTALAMLSGEPSRVRAIAET